MDNLKTEKVQDDERMDDGVGRRRKEGLLLKCPYAASKNAIRLPLHDTAKRAFNRQGSVVVHITTSRSDAFTLALAFAWVEERGEEEKKLFEGGEGALNVGSKAENKKDWKKTNCEKGK